MTRYDDKCMEQIGTTLETEVKRMMANGEVKAYFDCCARFNSYSYNNMMLIRFQMPGASQVCSRTKWAEIGGHLKDGVKPLRILAPVLKKQEIIVDDETVTRDVLTGYRVVSVYDISQVDGAKIASPMNICKDLVGDIEDFDRVFSAIRNATKTPIGWMTEDDHESPSCHGYYSPARDIIRIRPGMTQAQTIKTTIHEVAHSLLHSPEAMGEEYKGVPVMEMEAEATAYVVCSHFGLDTSDYSLGYIVSWGYELLKRENGWERFSQMLKGVLDVSKRIIDNIDPPVETAAKSGGETKKKAKKKVKLTFTCVGKPASTGKKKVGVIPKA